MCQRKETVQNTNKIFNFIRKNRLIIIVVISLLLVAGIGATAIKISGNVASNGNMAIFTVRKGNLKISVTEAGTIKPREQAIIKSEVEGQPTILSLIPEGAIVKKGELLIELDSADLLDSKIEQEIKVQNAEASFVQARENLAVVENQSKSDIDKAQLTLEFAKQDLDKYIKGDYPNQLKEAQNKITIAQEERERTKQTYEWSQKLYAEKYISQTQLQADELAFTKSGLDLELAESNLELLKNFTYKRQSAQYESDIKQADMALERTNRKANADVVQAKAELVAKEAEFNQQKDKLAKLEKQIEKTKIYAPADGPVIYASSARSGGFRYNEEPLTEGQVVHERQELIYIPTASSVKAEITIHESSLEKVKIGMPVTVTVDALPGKKYTGQVAKIAPLPNAQSMYLNPDLKVYNTEIYIDGDGSTLRTGMSCRTEIIVEQYKDVVYIPIQSVLKVKGESTVFIVQGNTIEPRTVELGMDNNNMVRIISGLALGEIIQLNPSLASAALEPLKEKTSAAAAAETPVKTEQPAALNQNIAKAAEIPQPESPYTPGAAAERKLPMSGADANSRSPRNLTPEQRQKMRERLDKMSPEEREKNRERFTKNRQNPEVGK